MSENLLISLQITVIGMGLVFAAILVLWAVMALLVRYARDPEAPEEEVFPVQGETLPVDRESTAGESADERLNRAAAVAVALALAAQSDQNRPHEFPLPPTVLVTAWQAVMRTRILNKRGPTKRGSSR